MPCGRAALGLGTGGFLRRRAPACAAPVLGDRSLFDLLRAEPLDLEAIHFGRQPAEPGARIGANGRLGRPVPLRGGRFMPSLGARIAERGCARAPSWPPPIYGPWERAIARIGVSPANVAIIVTQSCDLTHDRLEGEPVVEVMLGRPSERASDASGRGNFTGGKHPRCLCLPIQNREGGESWSSVCRGSASFSNRAAPRRLPARSDRFIVTFLVKTPAFRAGRDFILA